MNSTMTRRERLERKAEKRREWAESRASKSTQCYDAARREVEHIPFGQPILVGHHSERGHRATLKRCHNNMDKACEHDAMSKHHISKAGGIDRMLKNSIFSDDENAIEALEKRISEREKQREWNTKVNKIIRSKPKNECTEEKIESLKGMGINRLVAEKLFQPDFCGRIGIASYINQNLSSNIRSDKQRIADIKRRIERSEQAASNGGIFIEGEDYVFITFEEKPEREVLTELKNAGFRWSRGHWCGYRNNIPECVTNMM